jgi:SAM-dependent methyltransferase
MPRNEFDAWMASLESRHFAQLTFPEVSRALRALSSTYVERRQKLAEGAALAGAGKRAAFALFYGPLHYLLLEHVAANLAGATRAVPTLVDLGCGTGASGAAWARAFGAAPRVVAIDRHPWAVAEAATTYRAFGITATVRRGDIAILKLPEGPAAILAAFTLNELAQAARDDLLTRLIQRASRGDRVLVVEPLAGGATPWWRGWRQAFEAAGGRADEWRVRAELPPIVLKLDRAAGLNHREITGRSLWLGC